MGLNRVPRTHDRVRLAELVEECGGEPVASDRLELLGRYAVATRYEVPMPALEDAEEALHIAEDICADLLHHLTGDAADEGEDQAEPEVPSEEEDNAQE
ncbi:MAG: HEPN domain-containing protein [Armatimonadota bacterium]